MSSRMGPRKLLLLTVLVFLFLAAALAVLLQERRREALHADVLSCETAAARERFSCFRAALERHAGSGSVADYVARAKKIGSRPGVFISDYAVFGTNCHTFYHALGDFVAAHAPNLPLAVQLSLGSDACSSGYAMGLYKRRTYERAFADDAISEIYHSCNARVADLGECAHEVGHALADKHVGPVLAVLDRLTAAFIGSSSLPSVRQPEVSGTPGNIGSAFADCRRFLPSSGWKACYSGVAHNLFAFAEFDPSGAVLKKELRACGEISDLKSRAACAASTMHIIGTSVAAPLIIGGSVKEGKAVCGEAAALDALKREERLRDCYFGVGVGAGLYAESEYPPAAAPQGYAPISAQELSRYTGVCETVPRESAETCFRGLVGTGFAALYQGAGASSAPVERALASYSTGKGSP